MSSSQGVPLAIRSSVGIELWASCENEPFSHKPHLPKEETKCAKCVTFCSDGRYFAYANGQEIKVLRTADWTQQCALPRPKVIHIKFSPLGNYLATYELYTVTKERAEGTPNMFVYSMATNGAEVFSIVQKSTTDWTPSWSADEHIFAIVVGGEISIYDLSNGVEGFTTAVKKIGGSRGGTLSIGPSNGAPFLALYAPGSKGAPSMCKLYKYPGLAQNQAVACKSFFQADNVEILWNRNGSGLLLLTSTEVDKTGASYYGNQSLHFMSTRGDTCSVPLSKQGPVLSVKWSPVGNEFVVVYGFMPSKAALYNNKCDVIHDFGEGPRNSIYFNTFGNILILAGFGNLPGNVEVWDVKKRENITTIKCPDTTYFEWHPDGQHFITATTAPRLRISNGFKVYHYSGSLMHEVLWPQEQLLLGLEWQKYAAGVFPEPQISKAKREGIKSSQPEASKSVYTPPHLRYIKEGKNPAELLPQPGVLITENRYKNRYKKKNSKKQPNNKDNESTANTQQNAENGNGNGNGNDDKHNNDNNEKVRNKQQWNKQQQQQQQQQRRQAKVQEAAGANEKNAASAALLPDNRNSTNGIENKHENENENEDERKARFITKKLDDIKKLRKRMEQGENLFGNQLFKIAGESKLIAELEALKLKMN